jgi:hypothetical protein
MATFKFNTLAMAESFTARTRKIMLIMLGDDDLFWVVTPRHAAQLEKLGYEYAA